MIAVAQKTSSSVKRSLVGCAVALGVATAGFNVSTPKAQALLLSHSHDDMVIAVFFLVFFFPIGLMLDGHAGEGSLNWSKHMYQRLPFLKGEPAGQQMEHLISQRLGDIKKQVGNVDKQDRYEKIKQIVAHRQDVTLNETDKTFAIRLPESDVRKAMAHDIYSEAQISQAVAVLCNF